MDIATLKSEIDTDPEAIGYAAMTDEQVADSINTANRPSFKDISGKALLRWAAGGASVSSPARIVRIKLASELTAPFDGVGFVAQGYAAAAVAAVGSGEGLDYSDAATRGMVPTLTSTTPAVLTGSEADELAALGTESISRATELGLPKVKVGHVEQARTV